MPQPPSSPLPRRDADQLAAQLADVQQLDASLPEGLRAAAAEAERGLVAESLREIAKAVEQGVTLAEAVTRLRRPLPPVLRGAFAAAARSAELNEVLFDVLEHQNERRWEARSLFYVLAYPLVVLVVSVLLFCAVQLTVVDSYMQSFREFELQLPPLTRGMLWWSDTGAWMLLSLLAVGLTVTACGRLLATRQRWHRVLGALPLVGELWRCSGHSELTRLLGLLVARRLPLPEAVELAGDCCRNADVAAMWRQAAADVAGGTPLGEAVADLRRVPAVVLPYVSWGEQSGRLEEALEALSLLLAEQSRDRAAQLRQVAPPLMFLMVMVAAAATVVSLFAPLVGLLVALS